MTVFQNEEHHYEIAATRVAGQLTLQVKRQIGDLQATVASAIAPSEQITIQIEATPEQYSFGFSWAEEEPVVLATGRARYLGTEIAGAFTGCYFGIYAQSDRARTEPSVYIDWMALD